MSDEADRVRDLEARVKRLETKLARSEKSVRALRDVGLALGSTLDLDQILELILGKISELLDADRATLYLLDEHRGILLSRVTLGGEVRSIELPVGEGIAGHVAKYGKTARVKDAYEDARFTRVWDDLTGYRTRSILAAPMRNHVGRTIGVVQVLNKRGRKNGFSKHDEELLSALSTQAAISLDNSRLFLSVIQKNMQLVETKEQLEHRIADLALLFELETSMSGAGSLEDLSRAVIAAAARACGARAGGLLIDEGEVDAARAALASAEVTATRDWRISWYRGVADLRSGQPRSAESHFRAVYDHLPGELAPKLALGRAAEAADDSSRAARWYDIVSRTDPAFTSSAFGLARARAGMGDRNGALAALERVPEGSHAHTDARIAAVEVLLDRGDNASIPGTAEVVAAASIVATLAPGHERRGHLEASVLETALDLLTSHDTSAEPDVLVLGYPYTEHGSRTGLEATYRALARRAPSSAARIELVDKANQVRARSWW